MFSHSWKKKEDSGMVLMEINKLTGFQTSNVGTNDAIEKVEDAGDKVVFYLNQVSFDQFRHTVVPSIIWRLLMYPMVIMQIMHRIRNFCSGLHKRVNISEFYVCFFLSNWFLKLLFIAAAVLANVKATCVSAFSIEYVSVNVRRHLRKCRVGKDLTCEQRQRRTCYGLPLLRTL